MNIEILCPKEWAETWEISRKAESDFNIKHEQTLAYVIERVCNWLAANPEIDKCVIWKDFCDNSFMFKLVRSNGACHLVGGIIFHGLPEGGYRTHGSHQLTPGYGWQIHT